MTDFTTGQISKYNSSGALQPQFATSLSNPESLVFDSSGNLYAGQASSSMVAEFNAGGTRQPDIGPLAIQDRGTDWIDLASDQCTLYYTSEGTDVLRYNKCTNTQLANFNTVSFTGTFAYALRIRPNGEVLVADSGSVIRLDSSGNVLDTYLCSSLPGCGGNLFALNLDGDGTSFWTGDFTSGIIWRIDIATGNVLQTIATGSSALFGLTIDGQITVGSSTLTTSLSGGGQSGALISVPANTPVTDSATLSGPNAATATGTVTYSVYSDTGCHTPVTSGSPETITTPGTLPDSNPVSLPNPGTYYWQVVYSGDSNNAPATSSCGSEIETVTGNGGIAPANCGTIYGVVDANSNSRFFSVGSLAPHTLTALGGVHAGTNFEGIEIDPGDGAIYATTAAANRHGQPGFLYRVDGVTGALTPAFSTGYKDIEGLAFRSSGTLWGWVDGKGLIKINLTAGSASLSVPSARHFEALAWNNAGTRLYLAKNGELWTLNLGTGAFKRIASNLPGPVLGLDVRSNGDLLLGVAKQQQILVWDPTTKTTVDTIPTPGFKPIQSLAESDPCGE